MVQTTNTSQSQGKDNQTLTVRVVNDDTGRDIPSFDIPRQEKVRDAAARAAQLLGFASGGNYTLAFGGKPLDQNRPVGSYNDIKDGVTLNFIDIGGGV